MFHMCWAPSDGSSKLIPIDEQPNHQIVHLFRLGKAQGATHKPLHPGPEIDGLALDFLCVLLTYVMLLWVDMPLVGAPAVGVILGDAKGLQELLQLEEDGVLAPSEHIRQSHRGCAFACTKLHISSSSELSPRRTSSSSERQISTSTCSGFKTASTA